MNLSDKNTAYELKSAKTDVAFIPVGSTEQHGPHLPLCTDVLIAQKTSEKIAAAVGGYLLPAVPFGTCIENMEGRGTLHLSYKTLGLVIEDLIDALARHKFKKIFILNFHGGNFILPVVARDLNHRRKELRVFYLDSWMLKYAAAGKRDPLAPYRKYMGNDLHGGFAETSMMLHLAPQLVHLKRAKNTDPKVERSDLNHLGMVSATGGVGAWGQSKNADARAGKIFFEQTVAANIQKIRALLKKV